MKQKLIEKTNGLIRHGEELRQLWMDYVKEMGEIPLDGRCITIWDGCCERMHRIAHYDGDVFIEDQFGGRYPFGTDVGLETLIELRDVVLVATKQPSEE